MPKYPTITVGNSILFDLEGAVTPGKILSVSDDTIEVGCFSAVWDESGNEFQSSTHTVYRSEVVALQVGRWFWKRWTMDFR